MSPTKTTPSVARYLLQRPGVGTKVSSGSPRKGFQKRVAAPLRRRTSLHTLCKLLTQADATRFALALAQTARSLALKAVFPSVGRPCFRSSKSLASKARRNHDQYNSTGFKSGDLGGIFKRCMLSARCAAALAGARKNASLSQSAVHGPFCLAGLRR